MHVRMLLHSLRAHCKAPGGARSIWKYLEALVRATGVSGRFAYGFQTKLHVADVVGGHISCLVSLIFIGSFHQGKFFGEFASRTDCHSSDYLQ